MTDLRPLRELTPEEFDSLEAETDDLRALLGELERLLRSAPNRALASVTLSEFLQLERECPRAAARVGLGDRIAEIARFVAAKGASQ